MKFQDAQKFVIKYLDSDSFKNREDAQTTINAISLLKTINSKGFITENSQQGINSDGYNSLSELYYIIKERAYVNGFMKTQNAKKFTSWINTYTDKIAFIIYKTDSDIDFSELPFVPVTISASGINKKELTNFIPVTKIRTVLPESDIKFLKKKSKLNLKESIEYISVIDPIYGRKSTNSKGLFTDIISGLSQL
jgi:hypothetical protein